MKGGTRTDGGQKYQVNGACLESLVNPFFCNETSLGIKKKAQGIRTEPQYVPRQYIKFRFSLNNPTTSLSIFVFLKMVSCILCAHKSQHMPLVASA